MAFRPHIRCTALGTLPGGEIFSFGVSLGRPGDSDEFEGVISAFLDPNAAVYDDIASDFADYWLALQISGRAKLLSVKMAPIGTDGRYSGPSQERLINGAGGGYTGVSAVHHPNQVSLAVTLHSASDLGRVKGRFYLPMPGAVVAADGKISEADRDAYETASATFVTNLNNQPGLDVLDLKVVVASQGRRNSDGSIRVPVRNHIVNQVSVGRVLDTQRRRRNKVTELRGTPTGVS